MPEEPTYDPCPDCKGTGYRIYNNNSSAQECKTCEATGQIIKNKDKLPICPKCYADEQKIKGTFLYCMACNHVIDPFFTGVDKAAGPTIIDVESEIVQPKRIENDNR